METPLSQSFIIQEVDSEEAAIKAGYEEGEDLCEQIGLTLSHIIDIE